MVDSARLKQTAKRKGYSQKDLAEAIQMTQPSLSRKMKGTSKFTVEEALQIWKTLRLTQREFLALFFANIGT